MKYVVIIAVILAILFGFSVGASFLAAVWIATIALLILSAAFMAITELIEGKFWSTVKWLMAGGFFVWLISICY